MPRKKRVSTEGPLSKFILKLVNEEKVSLKRLAEIAGVAPSVMQGWKDGATPCETLPALKKLCNHYGYALSFALTGTADEIDQPDPLKNYIEDELFDGFARIKIMKLIPRKT